MYNDGNCGTTRILRVTHRSIPIFRRGKPAGVKTCALWGKYEVMEKEDTALVWGRELTAFARVNSQCELLTERADGWGDASAFDNHCSVTRRKKIQTKLISLHVSLGCLETLNSSPNLSRP